MPQGACILLDPPSIPFKKSVKNIKPKPAPKATIQVKYWAGFSKTLMMPMARAANAAIMIRGRARQADGELGAEVTSR